MKKSYYYYHVSIFYLIWYGFYFYIFLFFCVINFSSPVFFCLQRRWGALPNSGWSRCFRSPLWQCWWWFIWHCWSGSSLQCHRLVSLWGVRWGEVCLSSSPSSSSLSVTAQEGECVCVCVCMYVCMCVNCSPCMFFTKRKYGLTKKYLCHSSYLSWNLTSF